LDRAFRADLVVALDRTEAVDRAESGMRKAVTQSC
jgi:hypothetical protein